ncbi:MAG TPA: RNA polymerase sigma factor [Kofleriaceae bacterium]|nr:RNA polymerase sigma factor [Kofleriaceae bacterium]
MIDSTQLTQPDQRLCALLGPIHDEIRALARRIARSDADGDDLFHEAAIRALQKLDDLRDDDKFRAWFFSILLSVHRNRYRKSFWKRLVPLSGEDHEQVASPPAVSDPGSAERARRALATLPPSQREAIVLFELHEMSIDEIAALQGASPSAVKSRLSRGRKSLRRFYRRLGVVPATRARTQGSAAICKGDLS